MLFCMDIFNHGERSVGWTPPFFDLKVGSLSTGLKWNNDARVRYEP